MLLDVDYNFRERYIDVFLFFVFVVASFFKASVG